MTAVTPSTIDPDELSLEIEWRTAAAVELDAARDAATAKVRKAEREFVATGHDALRSVALPQAERGVLDALDALHAAIVRGIAAERLTFGTFAHPPGSASCEGAMVRPAFGGLLTALKRLEWPMHPVALRPRWHLKNPGADAERRGPDGLDAAQAEIRAQLGI